MESVVALRRRYSTSPMSPFTPMFFHPYAGAATFFSNIGFLKKPNPASSVFAITSLLIPWFITLKKPYSSHAFTISFATSALSNERSTTGSSLGRIPSLLIAFGAASTMFVSAKDRTGNWKKCFFLTWFYRCCRRYVLMSEDGRERRGKREEKNKWRSKKRRKKVVNCEGRLWAIYAPRTRLKTFLL